MKKKAYKAINIKKINLENLSAKIKDQRIVFGIDVAKKDFFGSLMNEAKDVVQTIKWTHPGQSMELVNLIKNLPASSLEIAIEPSGTYGDPMRQLFIETGKKVFRVSPKRTYDAREVYDGVPSLHDAKSAAIIAKLHMDGASEEWNFKSIYERNLSAAINIMDILDKQFHQSVNRIEAQIARHWPEVNEHMKLSRATFLELIGRIGGPDQISAQPLKAERLMRQVGGSFLASDKITKVIRSAESTIGVAMTDIELETFQYLGTRTRELQKQLKAATKKVEELSQDSESVERIGNVVGKTTAAVIVSNGGDPLNYDSARKWLKCFGLNLKEKSSGKYKGKLSITKRGSGKARRWLYFGTLRLIQKDVIVREWYKKKVIRDGGIKMKAIVAILRKLVMGLWHVARGKKFDTAKMFNIKRLGLAN